VDDLEREAERAAAEIAMGDSEIARRQPFGERQSQAPKLQGTINAAKHQRLLATDIRKAMLTPRPAYSSRPVGPAKRFEE
jgi:hypothetical protein